MKRVFLIVLDSFGIGEEPDAAAFGDEGSNTLLAVSRSPELDVREMNSIGLGAIDGVTCLPQMPVRLGAYARLRELSGAKDTTVGHWEMAGVITEKPFPVFPDGFPQEVIDRFSSLTGRGVLCNKPYSGTQVIHDYGREHLKTGSLIVYTSGDSVFQIAAHKSIVPLDELYDDCRKARAMLTGKYGVGRVIARPFEGEWPDFVRTPERRDFSLIPPPTMLNRLSGAGLDVIGVGKIHDIFAEQGLTEVITTTGNSDGMRALRSVAARDFHGLCFVNLVDFDMLYGHRNDVAGYARALSVFDSFLAGFIPGMRDEDVLMITADHGCDPSTPSTDHSREYVPWLICGRAVKPVDLGTLDSFTNVAAAVCDYLTGDGSGFYAPSVLARMLRQ